jgi:Protein of unknown function (DUF2934)
MKTKVHAQSEMPTARIPVVSQFPPVNATVVDKSNAVTDMQIQELAYKLYEERGRTEGNDLQDWLEAESLLRERGKLAA